MASLMKRRLCVAPDSADPALLEALCRRLTAIDSVGGCRVRGRCIELSYDPLKVDFDHLAQQAVAAGLSLDSGWLQRCLRAWYQYQDEAVCENAGAAPPACCNKPPRRQG